MKKLTSLIFLIISGSVSDLSVAAMRAMRICSAVGCGGGKRMEW